MKRALLSAVIALLVVGAMPTFATAADSFKNVVIRNTAAEPVPTQPIGTTAVSGGVAVTNTPAVNIANTPAVRVQEPVEVTGDVTADRGEPWQQTGRLRPENFPTSSGALSDVYQPPPGKDLVVTFITMRARRFGTGAPGSAGEPLDAYVTSAEGPGIQVFVPLQRQGDADVWSASFTTDVRFPTQMAVAVDRTPAEGVLQYDYTISGYLVDEPAP